MVHITPKTSLVAYSICWLISSFLILSLSRSGYSLKDIIAALVISFFWPLIVAAIVVVWCIVVTCCSAEAFFRAITRR